MLGQRIATAVVLLALLLPALFAQAAWPFPLFTLALVAAAAWEWGRLNGAPFALSLGFGAALAAAGAAAVAAGWTGHPPGGGWWLVALAWVLVGGLALRGGPAAWPRLPAALRWPVGLLMLGAAWLAMAQSRALGLNFLLSVFALVWVSDIAAYAGGRAFGRRKLAPTISPGKTWEGVFSALLGVGLLALAWTLLVDGRGVADGPSLYARLAQALGWGGALLALAGLTGLGVVGDLCESLVKRAHGAKDSSGLLPGHGGVLDRIDALLPVFPLAAALASL